MTAERIANHADDVLAVLQVLAELLGDKGRPADKVIALVRAALAAIIGEDSPHDPAAIRELAASLRDQLAANDAKADGKLAAKFDTGGES
ncbi:MAG: hypothetical protein M3R63_18505 [Actinomycetota bacterium]|nr:hypothetical protein [Actinomycetota bacterium]